MGFINISNEYIIRTMAGILFGSLIILIFFIIAHMINLRVKSKKIASIIRFVCVFIGFAMCALFQLYSTKVWIDAVCFATVLTVFFLVIYLQEKSIQKYLKKQDFIGLKAYTQSWSNSTLFGREQKQYYLMICNFILNEPDEFLALIPFNTCKISQNRSRLIKLLGNCMMYLYRETEEADKFYNSWKNDYELLRQVKKNKYAAYVDMIDLIHAYHQSNFDFAIQSYEDQLSKWKNDSVWGILTYYYCKALKELGKETEFEETVQKALERLEDNNYRVLFEEWAKLE